MGPRKKVRHDLGKRVVTRMDRVNVKAILEQAALSIRGKSWGTLRADIARALSNKQAGQAITPNETVAIECKIDGRDPLPKEVNSIETSINNWLAYDVKSLFRIRYIETINKIVILPEEQITALFGKRAGRGSNHG
jgi:hypothetical protein